MKKIFSILFALVLVVGLGLATAVPVLAGVNPWTNITQIAAGDYHTLAVRSDGTVVYAGDNSYGDGNVGNWTGINQTAGGNMHTVGLKTNGTVVAVGDNSYGQRNVGGWTNITQISAGWAHTVGLRSNGTVVAVGLNYDGQCNVGNWTNIVQVAASFDHTVGLKSDGTVLAVGRNQEGQCNVGKWTNITQIAAGDFDTVGLKSDGTVVAVGLCDAGACDVSGWTNITQITAGTYHTVGLKSDGTVVAVGDNYYGQRDVGDWTGITQIAAGCSHTVGLKNNGTPVAVGDNSFGQCNVPVTDTVTNGTVDARDEADTEVAVTGTATVTVFQYPSNPGGSPPSGFSMLDKYIDVYVPDTGNVTEIEIRHYYTDAEVAAAGLDESSLRLSWWNGSAWVVCSDSGVNTASIYGYSGYMWAKIRTNTTPSLAQLQGTGFSGVGYQAPSTPGGCFIATAAYGTDTAKELDILREFRDTVLLPNSLGAKFVSFYYRTSPPIANFISQHEVLRTVVRVGFVDPIVAILSWTHGLWSAGGS